MSECECVYKRESLSACLQPSVGVCEQVCLRVTARVSVGCVCVSVSLCVCLRYV